MESGVKALEAMNQKRVGSGYNKMVGPGVNNYNWGLQDKKGLPQGLQSDARIVGRRMKKMRPKKFIKTVKPGDRKV